MTAFEIIRGAGDPDDRSNPPITSDDLQHGFQACQALALEPEMAAQLSINPDIGPVVVFRYQTAFVNFPGGSTFPPGTRLWHPAVMLNVRGAALNVASILTAFDELGAGPALQAAIDQVRAGTPPGGPES